MQEKESFQTSDHSRPHIATVIAIAFVIYLLATSIHEILGHCVAAVAVGGKPLSVSTTSFDYDMTTVSRTGQRVVDAAGSIANLSVAVVCLAIIRFAHLTSTILRYFLWLSMNVNVFSVGSYLLTPFLGLGDWARFIEGLEPEIAWKIALTATGVTIIFLGIRLGSNELQHFLSSDTVVYKRNARFLTLVPYLSGGFAESVSGIFSPLGFPFGFLSAIASSFGRQLWLVLFPGRLKGPSTLPELLFPNLSVAWIVTGIIALVIYVGVLGPGLTLSH